ncbi:carbohydrate ABC transporter permease [Streptomyces sp. W16]|uniref:carbohydrate ABC transporter permease n=1 Tax=Streptomyces sp. W16 TaxID=3076631 RepID=UPI00295B82EB|nr:carbohydrate ABC transporter permease [Streptomyces sp. W16]MDV9171195.1 carbohydrate ABC transporter permease [Streptomyces sp. W16]
MNHDTPGYRAFRYVTLTLLSVFVAAPLYVMLASSLKTLPDVQGEFTWFPSSPTIQSFIDIWHTVPLAQYFVTSLIVAVSATVLSVLVAIFASYALSRWTFPGSASFKGAVLATQMFPGILFLLPLYLLFVYADQNLGTDLVGTRTGLVVTYLTFSLPFAVWMLVGYFDTVPRDLDEAAKVDGAGPLRTLLQIIVPAATPGIVAVCIYAFMTAWGEVLFASVLTTEQTRTLAVGLQAYSTEANVYWNQVMAASLVVSVPVVAGFLLLQRFLITGFTAGAVK